jgi:hypothetical protein
MPDKTLFENNVSNYHNYAVRKCNAHYKMAERYKRNHRSFGVSVVVLTSVVGTSVFASLTKITTDLYLQIATGFLSIIAVVMAALQTFLGYADLQVQHKNAGVGYAIVRRSLEILLMKFPDASGRPDEPGTKEFDAINKQIEDLDRASPTIPDNVWISTK